MRGNELSYLVIKRNKKSQTRVSLKRAYVQFERAERTWYFVFESNWIDSSRDSLSFSFLFFRFLSFPHFSLRLLVSIPFPPSISLLSFFVARGELHTLQVHNRRKKKITFVNQAFNATDPSLRTRACSSDLCSQSGQTNAQTKIEHITWELRDIKSIVFE